MIRADIDPAAVQRAVDAEFAALSRRVRLATEKTGREAVLLPLRRMTAQALRSRKLPTAWRGVVFPKGEEETVGPAYFAYTESPKIIAAFETGAEISPIKGKFLAIPTIAAGRNMRAFKSRSGFRTKAALTPAQWEKENGVKLRFVPAAFGGLLIADEQSFRSKRRKQWRAFTAKRPGEKVMFILVRRVRLAKRLDVASIAETAGAAYRISYQSAANSQ